VCIDEVNIEPPLIVNNPKLPELNFKASFIKDYAFIS
jgi:hypothetical protein